MLEDETHATLLALRDVGLDDPEYADVGARCRRALQHEVAREQQRPGRTTTSGRTKPVLAVFAAVAAIGGTTAAAQSLFGAADLTRGVHQIQATAGFVSRSQVTSITPKMADTYRVLARPQRPGDQPPAIAVSIFAVAYEEANPALARRALTTPRGQSAYVIPGNGAVCLATYPQIIGGCGPFPRVAANQMAGGTAICSPGLPSNEIEIGGLLPSDATNLVLHFNDRSTERIIPTNGVFIVDLPRTQPLPTFISWKTATGLQHADTGTPGDAATSPCATTNRR